MAEVLVSGDAKITTNSTIYQPRTNQPENLTDCTVFFQMRRTRDRRLMINKEADVVAAPSGEVSYLLEARDLVIPGNYVIQWQVVYPDGKRQTTRTLHEVEIRRR